MKMTTSNDLIIRYAELIQLCKGTKFQACPWRGVGILLTDGTKGSFDEHPRFNGVRNKYSFAVAILEDKPVWEDSVLYNQKGDSYKRKQHTNEFWGNNDTDRWSFEWITKGASELTWKPSKPKRTITIQDTGEIRQPKEGEYVFNNGNLCLCRKPERWGNEHEIWAKIK